MIDKKDVDNFVAEIDEITTNIEGIKGEMYTNGLFIIINVINLTNVTAGTLSDRATDKEAEQLQTLANAVISDTIVHIAFLLCPSLDTTAQKVLCTALAKDARILVDKQNEYTTKVEPK